MNEIDHYNKTELRPCEKLIDKLIYLLCETGTNFAILVGQLSQHNTNLKIGYLRLTKKMMVKYLRRTMHPGFMF